MLEQILSLLVFSSLATTVVRRYLAMNKLWVRRKERVVAESISPVALLLGIGTNLSFASKDILRGDLKALTNEALAFAASSFMVFIGIGFWVPGRRATLWARLAAALRLEGQEAAELLKRIVRPQRAAAIMKILHYLAAIDSRIDQREQLYIEDFAAAWGLSYQPEQPAAGGEAGYRTLRQSVVDYLAGGPSKREVDHLREVIKALVKIDDEIAPDEERALAELLGLLDHHITGEGASRHHVAIVPQNTAQELAILDLVPGARKMKRSGGDVFLIESCFSESFAEILCKRYRSLRLLTLVLSDEEAAS